MAKKSVTDRMKEKHDEYMEEEESKRNPFNIKSAIQAKRKHKKQLEEGVLGIKRGR